MPISELIEVLELAAKLHPVQGYILCLSHDENVFQSGQAASIRDLITLAKSCATLDEFLGDLKSRVNGIS